jgi:hypothetical protein
MEDDASPNFDAFRELVFSRIVEISQGSIRKAGKKSIATRKNTSQAAQVRPGNPTTNPSDRSDPSDPSELVDFSNYVAGEIFSSLPVELGELSHQALQENVALSEKWSLPLTLSVLEDVSAHIPADINDSLVAYGLIQPPKTDIQSFLSTILSSYIATVSTPPPKWIETRTNACEICERDWVPMTYHHLIPKQVHAKVLKRGWHEEKRLNSVAWLCRACHSFVHRMASNEDLAREYYTVERICEREDVHKWAQWVRKVRWKKT